jgi:hypothetical protein
LQSFAPTTENLLPLCQGMPDYEALSPTHSDGSTVAEDDDPDERDASYRRGSMTPSSTLGLKVSFLDVDIISMFSMFFI